jgi:hypothetical protein
VRARNSLTFFGDIVVLAMISNQITQG